MPPLKSKIYTKGFLLFMQPDYLTQELDMAKKVQQGLLAIETPSIPGFKIEKRCVSADSVGGDFYILKGNTLSGAFSDTTQTGVVAYQDQRNVCLDLIIGDVAGHGVSSALVMALTSGLMGEIMKSAKSPASVLHQTNNTLLPYLENSQIRYVTGISARFFPKLKRLVWANGGHLPALIIRQNDIISLPSTGMFLGMFENEPYTQSEIQLEAEDRVIFYTDGLLEARNPKGEEFGESRWEALLQITSKSPLPKQMDDIYFAISAFTQSNNLKDDQTLVMIEVE
jgi:sigma-B regulation protein RsbU (phosphoserine phosphatase)